MPGLHGGGRKRRGLRGRGRQLPTRRDRAEPGDGAQGRHKHSSTTGRASGRPGPLLGKGEAKPGRWGFDPASPCLGDSVATSIPSLTTPLGPHAADRNAEERAAPPALDFAGEQKALWRFPRKRKGGKRPPDAGGRGILIGDLPPWGEADESISDRPRSSGPTPPATATPGRGSVRPQRACPSGRSAAGTWVACAACALRPRGPAARGRCHHRETRSRRQSPPARCSATRLCQSNGGDLGRLTVRPRPDAGRRGERVLSGVRAAVRPSVPILLGTTRGSLDPTGRRPHTAPVLL